MFLKIPLKYLTEYCSNGESDHEFIFEQEWSLMSLLKGSRKKIHSGYSSDKL